MKKYMRIPFEVSAVKYEIGKGYEDGFKPWAEVITHSLVATEGLVRIEGDGGVILCPYVKSRRGLTFIKEGDYIILESSGDKHCCGEDKFSLRYKEL